MICDSPTSRSRQGPVSVDYLQSVQHVFSHRLFRIPDYQRGYAWHHQQWIDLLEDLELLAEGRDHFTGTLVLCRAQGIPKRAGEEGNSYDTYDVVDGQQCRDRVI